MSGGRGKMLDISRGMCGVRVLGTPRIVLSCSGDVLGIPIRQSVMCRCLSAKSRAVEVFLNCIVLKNIKCRF